MKKIFFLLLLPLQLTAQNFTATEITRWQTQSQNVTIIRDNWGIPHIYGKTDADAVFGLLYAQCEDDFKRVEMNYIEKLGRLAEVKGESELYNDLLVKMLIDTADAKKDYDNAPQWLQKLCNAFADGINYYLYKNPSVKPALLTRFKPWYPLLWTDGSIGAINTAAISSSELKNLYSGDAPVAITKKTGEELPTGSNGFAFAPAITASGNAILYINPHVTFYFRPEVQMASEEGLDVYGAVTWGQFFVYQGFNEHCGWMHTSSGVDAADAYIEKLSRQNNHLVYEYDHTLKPVLEKKVILSYKGGNGMETKTITVLYTHHGPIMARRNGQLLSMRADNRLLNGLIQCWQRTKANSFADFKKTLDLKGNITNNTLYADAEGNIAYWHGNRIPVRDTSYNWGKPVDGSISATEWKGYHPISEIVQSINPPNGWLQNCNSTPFTVAGTFSPKRQNYPAYMAPDGENFRGINAVKVLAREKNYTLDKVIATGYDTHLAAFENLVPALVTAFEKNVANTDTLHTILAEPIAVLKSWDLNCSAHSIATTLAVSWVEKLVASIARSGDNNADFVANTNNFAAHAKPQELLQSFLKVVNELKNMYGTWQMEWGSINRFQRISPDIDNKFDDNKESIPVGFASSLWGMLPSYASKTFTGTKKRYGLNGNSFICAVEFCPQCPAGKKIKAKSLLAGGESGNINSKHFFDQGEMYSKGLFKDVLFYKEDVLQHAEKTYHPGE